MQATNMLLEYNMTSNMPPFQQLSSLYWDNLSCQDDAFQTINTHVWGAVLLFKLFI